MLSIYEYFIIDLLGTLKHKNIIKLNDVIKDDSNNFDEVYLIFELM